MKRKDIFLDFTSLLDVTLIVIFFFVIFSHFEEIENANRLDEKVSEYEVALERAEEREKEATDLVELLKKEIDIARESNVRTAEDLEGILEFTRSGNIKLILGVDSGEWALKILCKNEIVNIVNVEDDMYSALIDALTKNQYDKEDTILCDLVFDASQVNTVSAYRTIKKAIEELQKEYEYLYLSETDLSVGED